MSVYGNSIINESSFLKKASFGFKIKPHQNLDETLKKHKYEGYYNFIKSIKDIDDLNYMRQDTNRGINEIKKISERIEKINKLGDCKETESYYIGINKKYISKGINTKDCDLTIKWYKEEVLTLISQKLKELRKD